MNENWTYLKQNIAAFPEYRSAVFEQGFLVTDRYLTFGDEFPFFNQWRCGLPAQGSKTVSMDGKPRDILPDRPCL